MANSLPSIMHIDCEQKESNEYFGMKMKDSVYRANGKRKREVNANRQSVKEIKPTPAKAKSGHGAAAGTKGSKASAAKKQTDVTHYSIWERVVQMLAVRPFKKLELYTRLQNEGLRDSERSRIANLLRDIALFRDNAYILQRNIWNVVKEDWPFYSEQERQQMKTNKQQNLTPPRPATNLTSGQSQPLRNSQLVTDWDSNGGNGLKCPSQEYYGPAPSKKQRISHLLTKERVGNHMNPTNANNLVHAVKDSEECSGTIDGVTNTNKKPTELKKKSAADVFHQRQKSNTGNNKEESQTRTNLPESSKKQSSSNRSKETTRKAAIKKDKADSTSKTHLQAKPEKTVPKSANPRGLETANHVKEQNSQCTQHGDLQEQVEQQISEEESSKPVEPQQQHSATIGADTAEPEIFDFSAYLPIQSIEQRRLYKADFERDYVEYSKLLAHVEHVRLSFDPLVSLLEQLPPDNPRYAQAYQQIIDNYKNTYSLDEMRRMKRFNYLHAKLMHITFLVSEYDKTLTSQAEASVLQQQQQQNLPVAPIPEEETTNSHAVNASTHMLTNSTQPNGHALAMETNSNVEAEIVQPTEVPPQNMKQLKTNRKESEPGNGHPKDPTQLPNFVGISSKVAAPIVGAQQTQQGSKHISDHSNYQEDYSSAADLNEIFNSLSSDSDDSSDSESSDDSSEDSSSESSDSDSSEDSSSESSDTDVE